MDYISHLDVISPDTNNAYVAGWSGYQSNTDDPASLTEQLQTTLDIEQLLTIYLSAIGVSHKISAVELDTLQGKFVSGSVSDKHHELSLPIQINDRIVGRLRYFSVKPVTDILLSSLSNFQKRLVFPLRNALAFWQLQQMALRDPLTGIGNRASYDDSMGRAMCLAKRNATPFALVLLDLDNFKQANDNHGHQVGDEILVQFTKLIQSCIRGTDQAFRFGGDEFAIILDNPNNDAALTVSQRIQSAMLVSEIALNYTVGVSIGYTMFDMKDSTSSLFARADKALYDAKKSGKSCIKAA